jgi:hypothetical protein
MTLARKDLILQSITTIKAIFPEPTDTEEAHKQRYDPAKIFFKNLKNYFRSFFEIYEKFQEKFLRI